jgi:hypothetical protein
MNGFSANTNYKGETSMSNPPKRRSCLTNILIIGAGSIVMLYLLFQFLLGMGGSRVPVRTTTIHQVRYEVGGSGRGDLTYRNATGATEQAKETIPWELAFQAQSGSFVYLSVQTGEFNPASCRILIDGVELQSASVDGDYSIATCSGQVP